MRILDGEGSKNRSAPKCQQFAVLLEMVMISSFFKINGKYAASRPNY
jgi:hypothetical protein